MPGRPAAGAVSRSVALVEAARAEFFEAGFSGARMGQIAARAGASKATLYRYFETKEALLAEVLAAVVAELGAERSLEFSATDDPRADLTRIGMALLETLRDPRARHLVRLAIAESERHPEVGAVLFRQVTVPLVAGLEHVLEAHAKAGRIACDNLKLATLQFLGLLKEPAFWPGMLGVARAGPRASTRVVVKEAVLVFLDGRGQPRTPGPSPGATDSALDAEVSAPSAEDPR